MSVELKYVLACASGIPWVMNWMNQNRPLILTYHGIFDDERRCDILPNTFVHIDEMVAQLRFVKKRYRIIHPDEFLSFIYTGKKLPPQTALVTFDDAYESFCQLAEPALRDLGIQALVFVPTWYVENQEPLWFDIMWLYLTFSQDRDLEWLGTLLDLRFERARKNNFKTSCMNKMKKKPPDERGYILKEIKKRVTITSERWDAVVPMFYPMKEEEIRQMSNLGVSFGGHTHTHTILTAMTDEMAENEIHENKRKLETILNKSCPFFAYPNGGEGDFNIAHKEILRRGGYIAAFSLTQKRSLPMNDTMDISRINVAPEDSPQSLAFRCTGIHSILVG